MNKGVPDEIRSLTLKFHYNDIESLKKLYDDFLQKFGAYSQIERKFHVFENVIDDAQKKLSVSRKDAKIPQLNILEMTKKKPSVQDAKNFIEEIDDLNIVFCCEVSDKIAKMIDDTEFYKEY